MGGVTRLTTFVAVVTSFLLFASLSEAVELQFSGFGDVTLGGNFGDPADRSDGANQDAFGVSNFPVNTQEGFAIVGTDFVVTAKLTDDLIYQGEINFQVERGNSTAIEVDPERFYLDYRLSDAVSIQAGLYFTPIGYHNRFLYSRAWLTNGIQIPDLFEEELNFVPTHSIGINAHGEIHPGGQTFRYAVGVANGRANTPDAAEYARDSFDNNIELTGLFEWEAPIDDKLIIGISAFTSGIDTTLVPIGLGTEVDIDTAEKAKLREWGLNPYLVYFGRDFNVLLEGVYSQIHDREGNQPMNHVKFSGFTGEVSLNLMDNKLHPYIRYDMTRLPNPETDPYYGLREDGGVMTRHFVGEFNGLMVGASYDLNPHARLKAEGIHNFSGPRDDWGIRAQIAFGF